jgi:hypothetical protein
LLFSTVGDYPCAVAVAVAAFETSDGRTCTMYPSTFGCLGRRRERFIVEWSLGTMSVRLCTCMLRIAKTSVLLYGKVVGGLMHAVGVHALRSEIPRFLLLLLPLLTFCSGSRHRLTRLAFYWP